MIKVSKSMLVILLIVFCIILTATSVNTNDGSLYVGGNANGVGTGIPVTAATVNINISSQTTQQLIAVNGSQSIYVTHIHYLASGITNVSLVYGTGTNCANSQVTLDGPLELIADTGYSAGNGIGAVMVIPSGNALCLTNSQAIQVGGAISYSQY